jgi:uncharacterized protein
MDKRTNRQLHRVLLTLSAALLLAFVVGYTGLSFGGVASATEKPSARQSADSTQRELDKLAEGLEKMPAATSSKAQPKTSPSWDTNMSEKELAEWAFNDASDFWAKAFANSGRKYADPRLWWVYKKPVEVKAGCGNRQGTTVFDPALGSAFYCKGNIYYTVYGKAKGRQYEAYGDFALAVILAHEMGHHVQAQLGYIRSLSSIQKELQADCFAGVWADSVWRRNQLSDGDIDEAMTLMAAIGDPPGVPSDDPQAHGTPKQRQEWFNQGWITGDPSKCKTW